MNTYSFARISRESGSLTASEVKRYRFGKSISAMAEAINVNRATLAKYLKDKDGDHHCMRLRNGKWQLLVTTRPNVSVIEENDI